MPDQCPRWYLSKYSFLNDREYRRFNCESFCRSPSSISSYNYLFFRGENFSNNEGMDWSCPFYPTTRWQDPFWAVQGSIPMWTAREARPPSPWVLPLCLNDRIALLLMYMHQMDWDHLAVQWFELLSYVAGISISTTPRLIRLVSWPLISLVLVTGISCPSWSHLHQPHLYVSF